MPRKNIRLASFEDAERILEIYNPYIENTCITFEYNPLTKEAFQLRMADIQKKYPWIVCEIDGKIIGYAYASPSGTRHAYSWNSDFSIYLDEAYQDQGIGSILYKTLILIMRELGYYNIYAVVTSPNPISLAFHQHLGFAIEGVHEHAGYKFGRWLGITRLVKKIGNFQEVPREVISIQDADISSLLDVYTD